MIFIADLIACSTCFGHHYAHHQELESIIQMVAACGIWCFGFQVVGRVWSWGLCVRFAGCSLAASTSWNPQGLSRPVMDLLYLLQLPTNIKTEFEGQTSGSVNTNICTAMKLTTASQQRQSAVPTRVRTSDTDRSSRIGGSWYWCVLSKRYHIRSPSNYQWLDYRVSATQGKQERNEGSVRA